MLLNDNEQQPSDSFVCVPAELTPVFLPRDESSEIMANMTKTLHMNTPEQTMNGLDIDDNDNAGNRQTNKHQLIEQLQAQLIHNQLRRTQARDYARILNHSNTPAYWYKAPPISRSVYFYDPNYQKQVQQQLTVSQRTKPHKRSIPVQSFRVQGRSINQDNLTQHNTFPFTPRTKYMIDLYNTAVGYQQQKQHSNQNYHPASPTVSQLPVRNNNIPSRLQAVPTLPPITISKYRNDDVSNSFIREEQNYELLNPNESTNTDSL